MDGSSANEHKKGKRRVKEESLTSVKPEIVWIPVKEEVLPDDNVKQEPIDIPVKEECLKNDNVKQEPAGKREESDVGHATSYGGIDMHEPGIELQREKAGIRSDVTSGTSSSSKCDERLIVPSKIVKKGKGVKTNKRGDKLVGNISMKTYNQINAGEKSFECDICMKTFTRLSHLNVHKRKHTGEKPFKCSICMKTFIQSSDLNRHKRIHTGSKPYACDVCSKTFSQSTDLNRHKRIHTAEKSFVCTICMKTFCQMSNLKIHQRIHTGDKPYECNICKKRFNHMTNLNSHKLIHSRR